MRYLLDTCTLIWFLSNDKRRMSSTLMEVIEVDTNDIFISTAAIWEIAVKSSLGKLELSQTLTRDDLTKQGFEILDIGFAHAMGVKELPFVHRDPFDRLMISQCKLEDLTAITPDPPWQDEAYGIKVLWD